jgi:O-antigen/teichoic acid export membrane protein
LARLLAAHQFGLYNLALTAAEIATGLSALGLDTALVRYIPVFANRRDEAGIWGVLQISLGLTTALSAFLAIGLYALANQIAEQWFHEPQLAPLLRLISLAVPFFSLNDMTAAATRGFKNMHYTVIAQKITHPLIKLSLIVMFVALGLNAMRALMASGLTEILVSGMLFYFLNKQFSLKRPVKAARRDGRQILKFSLPVYLSSLIFTFGGSIQTLLLGALNSVKSVGIFALAGNVNMIGKMFHESIVTVSMPIISELYSRRERTQLNHFYQTMTKWTFTLNLPMFLIVLLFAGPILSIFGKSFASGTAVLIILAWRSLVDTGTGICGAMLDMTGNTRWKLLNSTITFVLTLGINFLFIPRWGLVGAAMAALVSAFIINLLRLLEVYILLRMLPYNMSFIKPVTAGLVALLASQSVSHWLATGTNLISVATGVATLLAVYVSIILSLGLSREDRTLVAGLQQRVNTMLFRS